jgi:predicted flap endonuclease-1-like 5' DNA nuclease
MNLEQKISLMQNPIELEYLAKTSKTVYYGEETNISYRVGAEVTRVFVDERDVPDFLRYAKKGKKLFKIAEPLVEEVVEEEVVEKEMLDVDDFTIFKGIGDSSQQKLYDVGFFHYASLNEATLENINEIITLSEENYDTMKQKLEEILKKE